MNMDDDQIEHRLRHVRPIGPPASLRTRVLESARTRPFQAGWIYVPAAAALLLVGVMGWRTLRIYEALTEPHVEAADVERQATVDQLSRAWGDTEASRAAAAEALKAIEETARTTAPAAAIEGSIR